MYFQYVFFLLFAQSLAQTFHLPVKYRLNLYDSADKRRFKDDSVPLQYDCLYYQLIEDILNETEVFTWSDQLTSYCFRPSNESSIFTAVTLGIQIPDHQKYTFTQLKAKSVSSRQLLEWSAPVDLIENYQAYLQGETNTFIAGESIFFNCTPPWFGSHCEYFFSLKPVSLEEYIHMTYLHLFHYDPPSPSCYVDLKCYRRWMEPCLDWREICDGRQDCLYGEDEKDCWKLEANQCDENEYRCHNGQCIPLDFFNDDVYNPDCLDRTDESNFGKYSRRCTFDIAFRCEETACYPLAGRLLPWTCGDGQCINQDEKCFNGRFKSMQLPELITPWSKIVEECYRAMTCLTGTAFVPEMCYCGKGYARTCTSLMNSACWSDLFFFPETPVLLGHVYLIYNKRKVDNHNDIIAPMYVCFKREFCFMNNITLYRILNQTCMNYDNEFGILFPHYPGWNEMEDVIEAGLSVACEPPENQCPHPSLYQCDHYSQCLSTVRLRDGVINCPLGDDETAMNTCSFNETNKRTFRCDGQDWCLLPLAVNNGEIDCLDGEDEMGPNQFYLQRNLLFKFLCDGIQDMLPIIVDGQNMTDETECEQWPCNNSYTFCNSVWNCPKGEDELTCENPTDIRCHPCISPQNTTLICLPLEKVGDQRIDCLGASDERQLCRSLHFWDHASRYHCWNRNFCQRKDSISLCRTPEDDKLANLLPRIDRCRWTNLTRVEKHLCSFGDQRDYSTFEIRIAKTDERTRHDYPMITTNTSPTLTHPNTKLYMDTCHHGLLTHLSENGITLLKCICPPSTYGHHCEYQNQRVSLTVQARSSSDWRSMFTFLFILLIDQNEIESHDHRYYNPSADCSIKWNVYLLYRSRPKNPKKNYSVRIDVYQRKTRTLNYRAN